MKELKVEIDTKKHFTDCLFGKAKIETEEDEKRFIDEYNYTMSELARLDEMYENETQVKFDLSMRLYELNTIAQNSEYSMGLI